MFTMRKTYISAVLSGMLLFTACSDDLNTRPSTSLPTDEAIETNADLQLALNGVYQRVSRVRSLHAADFGLYADAKGGDTEVTLNSNQFSDVTNFQLNKQHSIPKDFYQEFSRVIAYCNQALEAGEKLPASEKAKAEYKYIKGQLIAARALFHFDMARLFSQLPTVEGVDVNAAQSGIVINDQVFNVFHQFKRSTIKETYDFIINGLNESLTLLSKDKQPGGINYYAAEALLARAYLYNGNWAEALQAAEDVIENSAAKLYTTENYLSSWSATDSDESLFEIYLTDNIKNNPQRNGLGGYTTIEGYGEVGVNARILSIFDAIEEGTDVRKSMVKLEKNDKASGWYVQKYKGRPDATNWMYVNNPKIIRLAEVYYIAAEAALKSGNQAKADKYYNELRETRFENGYVAKNNVTIDDILADRRIELFCENHRMFDLVRNNKEVPSWNTDAIRKPNAFDILCPIPQSETDVNPDMKQNPGF